MEEDRGLAAEGEAEEVGSVEDKVVVVVEANDRLAAAEEGTVVTEVTEGVTAAAVEVVMAVLEVDEADMVAEVAEAGVVTAEAEVVIRFKNLTRASDFWEEVG